MSGLKLVEGREDFLCPDLGALATGAPTTGASFSPKSELPTCTTGSKSGCDPLGVIAAGGSGFSMEAMLSLWDVAGMVCDGSGGVGVAACCSTVSAMRACSAAGGVVMLPAAWTLTAWVPATGVSAPLPVSFDYREMWFVDEDEER